MVDAPGRMVISFPQQELDNADRMIRSGDVVLDARPSELHVLQGQTIDMGPFVTRVIGTRRTGDAKASVTEVGWFDIDVEYQQLIVEYPRWTPSAP